jgi:hypothetical protein
VVPGLPVDMLVQLRAKIDSLVEAIYHLETQINDGGDQAFHPWSSAAPLTPSVIITVADLLAIKIISGLFRPELLSKYQTILSFTHSLSASLIPPPPPPIPKGDELQRERDRREYERAWKRTTANVVVHPSKPAEMEQASRLLNMLVTKQVKRTPITICRFSEFSLL